MLLFKVKTKKWTQETFRATIVNAGCDKDSEDTRQCNNVTFIAKKLQPTALSDSCETSIIQRTAYKIIGQKQNRIAVYI